MVSSDTGESEARKRRTTSDLSVGELAARAGVPVSTLHYYESEGLIMAWRTPANHRRYDRAMLRRVAVIRVAQSVGLTLAEIKAALGALPTGKVAKADWTALSNAWRDALDARIAMMHRLRDQLHECIGCGCLSLETCPLYNPDDVRGADGSGPRLWIDEPS